MALLTQQEALYLKATYDMNMRQFAINVTDRCNMQCACCYKNAGSYNKDITKKIINKVFSFIDNSWCVTLTGGEATLRIDLMKYIVKKAKKLGCITRLASNGLFFKDIKKIIKMNIDIISLGINRFHTYDESIQKVIDILGNERVYSKLFIDSIVGDVIPYKLDKNTLIVRDDIWQTGRLDKNFHNQNNILGSSLCSCRGITVFPDGKIAPFCFHGKGTCVYWNIDNFQKTLIFKYFNSHNRRFYGGIATHNEENDAKERTNRTKGLPFM